MQLDEANIHIYSTNKTDIKEGGFILLEPTEVSEKWGVPAARIADVLTLTGDSSDNIPGIEGKIAAQLVTSHGSTQTILQNPSLIENPRLREKIIANREVIIANREMAHLDEDLPATVSWESLEISPHHPELIAALKDCEFKNLVSEIEAESAKAAPALQGELF